MPFLVASRIHMSPVMAPKIPPSISQLFHTNSVPSPMDTHRIHQLLAERNAELSAFNEEIERARVQVLRLEKERDNVQGILEELEALMSPVRRVPTDIMTRIFEHCIRGEAIPKSDPRTAPLILGQICRSWRYLLFSLPYLWTALQLDFPPGTKDWESLMQSRGMSMHVWISRSKALPISLFLNHPKGSIIPWHALMHLDKEILTLSCRLRDLTLHFSPRSLSCLLTFTQSPLPFLQHLELLNTNSLPTSDNPPPIVLHSAPSLRSLCLSWDCLDLRAFQIPWDQLQHLSLQYDASSFWNPIHSDYLQTLSRCPNLTTLCVGVGAPINDIDPTTIEPVTLPNVHTFKASVYVQTPYLRHLFDALRMPKLRQFDIKNVSLALGSFTGETECLPFLTRCADTLEAVGFNRIDVADSAILSCLSHLHRLKTLFYLPGILRLNHGLITALTYGHPNDASASGIAGEMQHICAALETLHLRCSSVVPTSAIADLVASRCRAEPKLKRFSLQFATFGYGLDIRDEDEKIKDLHTRLKVCVDEGLQLVLSKSRSSSG